MSASGYKRTCGGLRDYVRFAPNSGHSEAQARFGLKKQTLNVRLAPDSGRKWVTEVMSATRPIADIDALGAYLNKCQS